MNMEAEKLNLTSIVKLLSHVHRLLFEGSTKNRFHIVGCKLHKPNDHDLSLICKRGEASTDLYEGKTAPSPGLY